MIQKKRLLFASKVIDEIQSVFRYQRLKTASVVEFSLAEPVDEFDESGWPAQVAMVSL